jgi:hypothetical protein
MTEPSEPKPESEAPPEPVQLPLEPAPEPAPLEAEKPKPGRFQHFVRNMLLWLVGIAVVFLAGVLTYHFVRYQPLSQTLTQTQSDLAQANQTIATLQISLATANAKATSLASDNQTLQSGLDQATAHLELLQVLVDISNARLALFQNDVAGAKTALMDTSQMLDALSPSIAGVDPSLAQSMPQRLNLINSELDRDVETAKIDLELFTKDLLGIETALYGN